MKKYSAALAASAVFVAAIRLFRAPYLAWDQLWLVAGLSLLAAVSFGVIVWLTLAQRRTLSKKRSAAVLLSASAVLAAVQWGVSLAVNKDGLYNEKAADAADAAVFLLFGAALCVFFAVSSARKKGRAAKIICATLSAAVFATAASLPYLDRPALSPLNWTIQNAFRLVNRYTFSVDTGALGAALPNVRSHINRFDGCFPEDPVVNAEYNPYAFTEYIQLMECTGGSPARDQFADPEDFYVTDDYDCTKLIASCRGILKVGAKPLLKLGNVPKKLSRKTLAEAGYDGGDYDLNVYPPDDYNEYYRYIRAVIEALVDDFSREKVRTWHFGVLTEYNNQGWFHAADGDPQKSMETYCKLYDYTAKALTDVLGNDVFIGAHSVTCGNGEWDERAFIRHCGEGVNFATGEIGSPLRYLSASYYENAPGNDGNVRSLAEIMEILRGTAESVGLNDLLYGVDEGRLLFGLRSGSTAADLPSRTVGFTYQAAFDARLVKQMFDCGMNYFSNWEYCSYVENYGNPLISYFVAKNAASFDGARQARTEKVRSGRIPGAEVDIAAAFDETNNTLRVMAYNYKNTLNYLTPAKMTAEIHAPQLHDGEATLTTVVIDDDCNWFDEWNGERESLGFTDEQFYWSPDDGCIWWADEEAERRYRALEDRYAALCRPTETESRVKIVNGRVTLQATLPPHAVVFFTLTQP